MATPRSVVDVDLFVLADDVVVIVAVLAVLAVHAYHKLAFGHLDDVFLLAPRTDGLDDPMLMMAHAIASPLNTLECITRASKRD